MRKIVTINHPPSTVTLLRDVFPPARQVEVIFSEKGAHARVLRIPFGTKKLPVIKEDGARAAGTVIEKLSVMSERVRASSDGI